MYTLISPPTDTTPPSVKDLMDESKKIDSMKRIISLLANGIQLPSLLMPIIQYILPTKNKTLKRLLIIYWELIPKSIDGKLRSEMILVCNYLRNDLHSPNEYVRGMTLRLLCKISEVELLEPLVPSIRQCLEHRHVYVRKNALMTVLQVAKKTELIPDAVELVSEYISKEQDVSCIRNAMIVLSELGGGATASAATAAAASDDEYIQLQLLQLSSTNLQVVIKLLDSQSLQVKYQAVQTLLKLTAGSSNPVVVRECIRVLILIIKQCSNNNAKLIVFDTLDSVCKRHSGLIQPDQLVDVISLQSAVSDVEIVRRVLSLVTELVNARSIGLVVSALKKDVMSQQSGQSVEYTKLLLSTLHSLSLQYTATANTNTDLVYLFIENIENGGKVEYIKDILTTTTAAAAATANRDLIIARLLAELPRIKNGKLMRGLLWIIGEYVESSELAERVMSVIEECLGGRLPVELSTEQSNGSETAAAAAGDATHSTQKGVVITKDGSYSQQPATAATATTTATLKYLITNGDWYLACILAVALNKLTRINPSIRSKVLLVHTFILRYGRVNKIDDDSYDRVYESLRLLLEGRSYERVDGVLSNDSEIVRSGKGGKSVRKTATATTGGIDTIPVFFTHSATKSNSSTSANAEIANDVKLAQLGIGGGGNTTTKATTTTTTNTSLGSSSSNSLDIIHQLTGYSDAVYAECFVIMHQYDIFLDILIVNQTNQTLQNMNIEFSTLGDLKLLEKPSEFTLGPRAFYSTKVTIKVSSTDTAVVFGNIVYDGGVVILNELHIDIMEYIKPSDISEQQFRSMWTEFEWENRIIVNTDYDSIAEFVKVLARRTNMRLLNDISEECRYMSGNMYARSVFGEDVLVNLCLEKGDGNEGGGAGVVGGHVRIRSKTQGIAIAMGDKISVSMRK